MLRNLLRKTPLAWLQVKREKTRLAVALAGIAFADVLMFVQIGLQDALYDSTTMPYQALQGDVFIVSPLFESLNVVKSFSRERLYQAAGVDGVESVTSMYIARGKWRNPQNRTEQTLMVFGTDIGTFALGASFAADSNAITSDSTFLHLFPERQPEQIDVGLLKLKSGTDIKQVQATLQAMLPKDVLVLTKAEFTTREEKYWSDNSPIGFIFGFGAVIGFIIGTIIVYQILYSDVSEHLPEYATLKAMGYSDLYLIGVLVQESLILATLGFVPGFVLSFGLYYITMSATLLPIGMTLNRAVFVLCLTVVMCAASGGIAMRKLQTADPADIF